MKLFFSFLSILNLNVSLASATCPVTIKDVMVNIIDLNSVVGFVNLPPESADTRTVYMRGPNNDESVFFIKNRGREHKLLRQTSADTERWDFLDDCLVSHEKSSQPSSMALGFTDTDLRTLLAKNTEGLIYVWSPSLPLSVEGRAEIQKVADESSLPVTFLIDPNSVESPHPDPKVISTELRLLGGTRHYPALFFYKDGQLTSHAHIGRRVNNEWSFIIKQERKKTKAYSTIEKALDDANRRLAQLQHLRVLENPQLRLQSQYPLYDGMGNSAFFQVTPNVPFVLDYSYITKWQVHIIDQLTGKHLPTPILGGDPYPSPDGKFITTKDSDERTVQLKFYSLKHLLENPTHPTPFHSSERKASWWYPSIGVSSFHGPNDYVVRILTRFEDVRLDHFQIRIDGDVIEVTELGSQDKICSNIRNSGPVISRDGKFINAQSDDNTRLNVVRIPEDLTKPCEVVASLPFSGFKIAWHPNNSNQFSVTTRDGLDHYLYDIQKDVLTKFPSTTPECSKLHSLRIIDDETVLYVCDLVAGGTLRKHVYYKHGPAI
ncbi:MAG TPA: hypothetical protein VNJ01_00050 [Bacteriovoracaceae bacterium]|nr:hypothetical protein [Bacteriovoracaceae bacterium]